MAPTLDQRLPPRTKRREACSRAVHVPSGPHNGLEQGRKGTGARHYAAALPAPAPEEAATPDQSRPPWTNGNHLKRTQANQCLVCSRGGLGRRQSCMPALALRKPEPCCALKQAAQKINSLQLVARHFSLACTHMQDALAWANCVRPSYRRSNNVHGLLMRPPPLQVYPAVAAGRECAGDGRSMSTAFPFNDCIADRYFVSTFHPRTP